MNNLTLNQAKRIKFSQNRQRTTIKALGSSGKVNFSFFGIRTDTGTHQDNDSKYNHKKAG